MRAADEDLASALLWESGTRGIEVLAAPEGQTALLAYFDAEPELGERLASGLSLLAGVRLEPAAIPEVDWLARVREGFREMALGPFRILPAWDAPAARARGFALIVDPGRAFGTGSHETTRLCLQAIASAAAGRRLGSVLDLGAGTGILALAALKLGASSATAVDIDPDAIDSAQRHAALNRAALRVVRGDGARPFRSGVFDLILANVSAPLLLERRSEIVASARPGGAAILSGFLTADAPELRAAYSSVGSVAVLAEGEWAALAVHRLRQP